MSSLIGSLFGKSVGAQAKHLLKSEKQFAKLQEAVESLVALGPKATDTLKQFLLPKLAGDYDAQHKRRVLGTALALCILDSKEGPLALAKATWKNLSWQKSLEDLKTLNQIRQILGTHAQPILMESFREIAAHGDHPYALEAIALLLAFEPEQALDALRDALLAALGRNSDKLTQASVIALHTISDPRAGEILAEAVRSRDKVYSQDRRSHYYASNASNNLYQALAECPAVEVTVPLCEVLDYELAEHMTDTSRWTSAAVWTSYYLMKALGACAALGDDKDRSRASETLVRCILIAKKRFRDELSISIPALGSSALTALEHAIADPYDAWFGEILDKSPYDRDKELWHAKFAGDGYRHLPHKGPPLPTAVEFATVLVGQIRQNTQ